MRIVIRIGAGRDALLNDPALHVSTPFFFPKFSPCQAIAEDEDDYDWGTLIVIVLVLGFS